MLRFLRTRYLLANSTFTKWVLPSPSRLDHGTEYEPTRHTKTEEDDGTPSASTTWCKDGGYLGVYAGFDPTAPSLHLGNLAILMTLARLSMNNNYTTSVGNEECEHNSEEENDERIPRFQPYIVVSITNLVWVSTVCELCC